MHIKELDTVVLETDIADHRLKKGDIGTVVQLYPSEVLEVEFVTAAGRTQALITLSSEDVRAVGPKDIPAVRGLSVA